MIFISSSPLPVVTPVSKYKYKKHLGKYHQLRKTYFDRDAYKSRVVFRKENMH